MLQAFRRIVSKGIIQSMKELALHARNLLGIQLSAAQINALEIYEQELLRVE
jgi:hypothetical protein